MFGNKKKNNFYVIYLLFICMCNFIFWENEKISSSLRSYIRYFHILIIQETQKTAASRGSNFHNKG